MKFKMNRLMLWEKLWYLLIMCRPIFHQNRAKACRRVLHCKSNQEWSSCTKDLLPKINKTWKKIKVVWAIRRFLINIKTAQSALKFLTMEKRCRLCRNASTSFMKTAAQNGWISNLHVQIAIYLLLSGSTSLIHSYEKQLQLSQQW